jgi:uncharacterized protein YndB with AHSA1/START domain
MTGPEPGRGIASGSEAVVREVHINARPETVFPFFIDPARMAQWKGINCLLDPRPGGIYRCDLNGRDVIRGEFLEIVPFSRIVFTFGWEGEGRAVGPGASTVEVTLIPDGDGTIVRLRHSGLAAEAAGEHAQGWEHYLPRLAVAAGGGNPGPDPWAQPAPGS